MNYGVPKAGDCYNSFMCVRFPRITFRRFIYSLEYLKKYLQANNYYSFSFSLVSKVVANRE